jgi:hypothetical protein
MKAKLITAAIVVFVSIGGALGLDRLLKLLTLGHT